MLSGAFGWKQGDTLHADFGKLGSVTARVV
jgi:2-keto-4-pentenoate hydratase